MLRAIINLSWRQQSIKQQPNYGSIPHISVECALQDIVGENNKNSSAVTLVPTR